MKTKVDAECEACRGTGLYVGMCEKDSTAVVCVRCDGTGKVELQYTPFESRHDRNGIHTVYRSRGTFIATGVGPTGGGISYAEFKAGKMP